MICKNCGREVKENTDLCPNCAKPTESSGTVKNALKTTGRALGFFGRFIWMLINYALAVVCFAVLFAVSGEAWYVYILMPGFAIFLLINGTRCIMGKNYWIFY